MANNVTAGFREVWAKDLQTQFYKKNIAMQIADTSFSSDLKNGRTLDRPYTSTSNVQIYTRGSDLVDDDVTLTNEQMVCNREFGTSKVFDAHDALQMTYDLAAFYGKEDGIKLSNQIDADVLGEAVNAGSVVDGGDVTAGTAGLGISLTTSTVVEAMVAARKKLKKNNIQSDDLFGAISPDFESVIISQGGARQTSLGDRVTYDGNVMEYYGFKLMTSNQLTVTGQLSIATNPTANDTVTIAGQTFTFVSSIGTTAGNVLIGGSAAVTVANLVELINNPWTTTANGVALGTQNLRFFQANVSAVATSAILTDITVKGFGSNPFAETLTAVADVFVTGKIKQHNLFAVKGNPVLVVQKKPTVEEQDVQKRPGAVRVMSSVLYGLKSFADNKKNMVDVIVNGASY